MKKKLLALTMAFAMLLTGCGSAEDDDSNDASSNPIDSIDASVIAKNANMDPMRFEVAGQTYQLSAKDGVEDFNEIPNMVRVIAKDAMASELSYFVVENGIPTDEEVSMEEACLMLPWGQVPAGRLVYIRGQLTTDNGYVLVANDLSVSSAAQRYGFDCNAAMTSFMLVNDFSYLGIHQDSSEAEIVKAGFQPGYQASSYFYIYSTKAPDYEEIDETFNELCDAEVTNALINKDPFEYTDYMGQYILASGFNGADYSKFDVGFNGDKEYWSAFAKNYGQNAPEDCYKIYREFSMAIGQQLMYLEDSDIDCFIIVEVDVEDTERRLNAFEGNTCTITIVTDKDNVMNWPEKWGWEKTFTTEAK